MQRRAWSFGRAKTADGLDLRFDHDDDTDAAVGDRIEVEWAEVLRIRDREVP